MTQYHGCQFVSLLRAWATILADLSRRLDVRCRGRTGCYCVPDRSLHQKKTDTTCPGRWKQNRGTRSIKMPRPAIGAFADPTGAR